MANQYRIKGVSDDITTCGNCGKSNLKRTVALELIDEPGVVVHYGTDCAARALAARGNKVGKSALDVQAGAVAYVERLRGLGKYSARVIADAVWNRYGFLYDLRDGVLYLGGRGAECFAELDLTA